MIDTYVNGIKITDSNDGNEGQELFFENTANFMDIGRWETDWNIFQHIFSDYFLLP